MSGGLIYRAGALVVFTIRCGRHGRPTCWQAKCGRCGMVLIRHGFTRDGVVAAGLGALDHGHYCDAVEQRSRAQRRALRRQALYRVSRAQGAERP